MACHAELSATRASSSCLENNGTIRSTARRANQVSSMLDNRAREGSACNKVAVLMAVISSRWATAETDSVPESLLLDDEGRDLEGI